jgi:hypothetical protein
MENEWDVADRGFTRSLAVTLPRLELLGSSTIAPSRTALSSAKSTKKKEMYSSTSV